MPVPNTHQVIPGAMVNIVLKADQQTGRQVRGAVKDILTKGDHHRGIKVRLTDGRIGRVQSLALAMTASTSSSETSMYGSDSTESRSMFESSSMSVMSASKHDGPPLRAQGRRPRHRDARLDEAPTDAGSQQMDLGAYIVPSRRKAKGKRGANASREEDMGNLDNGQTTSHHGTETSPTTDITSAMATCPVCGAFEGDETAVAHHVSEHFAS